MSLWFHRAGYKVEVYSCWAEARSSIINIPTQPEAEKKKRTKIWTYLTTSPFHVIKACFSYSFMANDLHHSLWHKSEIINRSTTKKHVYFIGYFQQPKRWHMVKTLFKSTVTLWLSFHLFSFFKICLKAIWGYDSICKIKDLISRMSFMNHNLKVYTCTVAAYLLKPIVLHSTVNFILWQFGWLMN